MSLFTYKMSAIPVHNQALACATAIDILIIAFYTDSTIADLD